MKINCHIYPVSLAVPFQGCSSLGRTGHWYHLLEDIYWTSCARGKHQDGLQSIHMATPLHHVVPSRLPQDLSLEVFFSPLYSSTTETRWQCSGLESADGSLLPSFSLSQRCVNSTYFSGLSYDSPSRSGAVVCELTDKGKPRQSGQCFGSLVTSVRNWHSPLWPVYKSTWGF